MLIRQVLAQKGHALNILLGAEERCPLHGLSASVVLVTS